MFFDARAIDARFDIFTLGATMYHAFTGRHPFDLVPDPHATEGEGAAPRFDDAAFNGVKQFQEANNPLIRELIFRSTRLLNKGPQRYRDIRPMQKEIALALKGS